MKPQITDFFDILKPSELFFIGCTSPYYLGIAASAAWRIETGLPVRSIPSSDYASYPRLYDPGPMGRPVMVALSRSGRTTETIWAAEEFVRRYPGRMALIGCNPEGALAEMADLKVILPVSAEKTIPQTRSFSSMYLAALLMAGIYSGNIDWIAELERAPELVNQILQAGAAAASLLIEGKKYRNVFILGSGPLYGMALEIGLKCMEMSGTEAFSYHFLESRHGPRALIDENTLVIGLYSRGGLHYEAQLMEEYTLRHKATTLAITPEAGWETGQVSASAAVGCALAGRDDWTGLPAGRAADRPCPGGIQRA